MKTLSVADDGATTIEFTAAEARALRNVLADVTGSVAVFALQRHLAMVHGEAHEVPVASDKPCTCGNETAGFRWQHANGCPRGGKAVQ